MEKVIFHWEHFYIPIIAIGTMYYSLFHNRNTRITKYLMLVFVLLFSIMMLGRENTTAEIVLILVFCLDELLSIFPKLHKINTLRSLTKSTDRIISYEELVNLKENDPYKIAENCFAKKVFSNGNHIIFETTSSKNTETGFYANDFEKIMKLSEGRLKTIMRDSYGGTESKIYNKGDTIIIYPLTEHKLIFKGYTKLSVICSQPTL